MNERVFVVVLVIGLLLLLFEPILFERNRPTFFIRRWIHLRLASPPERKILLRLHRRSLEAWGFSPHPKRVTERIEADEDYDGVVYDRLDKLLDRCLARMPWRKVEPFALGAKDPPMTRSERAWARGERSSF